MKGKRFTQKELEEQGWELTTVVTNVHLIFKKGKQRICWNKETEIVEKEYTVKD